MITVSFVIPVFNEEKRIEKAFDALTNLQLPRGIQLEKVIFVDDGSRDKTVSSIEQFISRHPGKRRMSASRIDSGQARMTRSSGSARDDGYEVQIISYSKNMGKGYAIRQGMTASTSDYTLFFDADMSTPLSEIAKFVPQMKKGIGVIIGTRKNGKSTVVVHQPRYRELLGKGFTYVTNILLQTRFTDFTCGFKAVSTRARMLFLEHAKVNRWAYDAELLFLTHKRTLSHIEVPVVWKNDERTKVRLLKDIPSTIWELIAIRLHHAHPIVSSIAVRTGLLAFK